MVIDPPEKQFRSCVSEYSQAWWDQIMDNAYSNLARDDEGKPQPHCLTLDMYGSKCKKNDYFQLEVRGGYRAICYIFDTNEQMKAWIQSQENPQIIVHEVYVDPEQEKS